LALYPNDLIFADHCAWSACPKIFALHPRNSGTHPNVIVFEQGGFSLDLVSLRAPTARGSASSSWDCDSLLEIGSFAWRRAIKFYFYLNYGRPS
jgi:hypothetical protein